MFTCITHCYLLLTYLHPPLPETDCHFILTQTVEGCVDLDIAAGRAAVSQWRQGGSFESLPGFLLATTHSAVRTPVMGKS